MSRPCDRCNIGSEYDEDTTKCVEYSFASTVISWLCLDCRKDWVRQYTLSPLHTDLENLEFRLGYHNSLVENGNLQQEESRLEYGLSILLERQELINKMNRFAYDWLSNG